MAYYLDINEFFKQQKQAQERMKVFEKLEEQQRQNTLREAYKIIHKKKGELQSDQYRKRKTFKNFSLFAS